MCFNSQLQAKVSSPDVSKQLPFLRENMVHQLEL